MSAVFDHLWLGALFGDAEARAIWSAEAQLARSLAFEAAWSRALGEAGLADPASAEAAAMAIEAARPDMEDLAQGTARDGVVVPALARQLRRAAGEHAAAVHTGATSQDVIDTALALAIRDTTALLLRRLEALEAALEGLDARHGAARLMGRTRMQAAQPIAASTRLASWRDPLGRHRTRLLALRPRTELVQVGGAVGDAAALGGEAPAVAASLARRLGLHAPERSWHTARDGVAEWGGMLSLVTGSLGKMGQDVALMAQQGVDEIALAGGGGSSAMPHKNNPVLAELLVTLARFNAGQLGALHGALVHEQERSGAAWMLEWMVLPAMAMAAARSLSAALALCEQIVAIKEVAR